MIGVAAGGGAWRLGLHSRPRRTVTPSPLLVQRQGGSQPGTLPAAPSTDSAVTAGVGHTAQPAQLILVGSQVQGQAVREAAGTYEEVSGIPVDATVLVVSPAASAKAVSWLVEAENEAHRLAGLPPWQAVDVRTAATTDTTAPPQAP